MAEVTVQVASLCGCESHDAMVLGFVRARSPVRQYAFRADGG